MVITILVTACTAVADNKHCHTVHCVCGTRLCMDKAITSYLYCTMMYIYMYMSMGLTVSESLAKVYSEAGVLRLVVLLVRVETAYNT